MTILSDSLLTLRTTACKRCKHNVGDVCEENKKLYPERDCFVSVGITMDKAHCPIGEWWKACSCVWVYKKKGMDGLYHSIRLAEKNLDANNYVICGDEPNWWTGQIIPSRSEGNKWTDSLVKLQRIIDSPLITDNFLWMYCDSFILQPMTMQELAVPRYGEPPQMGSTTWRETYFKTMQLLKEVNKPTLNYSTHYPVVFNKHLLQDVLDNYKPNYLIETLYLNIHGKEPQPITDEFQFQRSCLTFEVPSCVKLLNVKSYTPFVKRLVEQS